MKKPTIATIFAIKSSSAEAPEETVLVLLKVVITSVFIVFQKPVKMTTVKCCISIVFGAGSNKNYFLQLTVFGFSSLWVTFL